ncbi:hypothetical protein FACS1894181_05750 [Bacteroidia bacterium]|nr:hypothetical protein FACS1894181_05750 [Bacteroidia bacterium]
MRFNVSCVEFVKAALKEIPEGKFAAIHLYQGSLLDGFHRVRIKDSTKFKIPDMLQEHYKGNGGSPADMKKKGMRQQEMEACLGNGHRLPVRMLLIPACGQAYGKRVQDRKKEQKKRGGQMSAEMCACYHFTIFITNVPGESLPAEMIYPLYKLRWQIELMFKHWKSLFCIHKSGKMKEERYLCLLYAKLILIAINLQIARRIQKVTGVAGTGGKVRLLSFNKALHTLIRYFNRLYCIIRAGKRMAGEALVSLFEILSKNHFLERKKNKEGLCELIERFLCVSV